VYVVLGFAAVVVAIYVAILGYLWATQRRHVFRPGLGPLDLIGSLVGSYMREESVGTADGLTLTAWYAPARPGHRMIVYFHGNAGTLADRHERVLAYLERGFGILLVGYRGYGGNPGLPTERGLYEDGRAHLEWLARRGIAGDAIALYGESLGAAVAIQMATERNAAALVLEAPFASIVHSARARYPLFAFDFLVRDKFASIQKIGKVKVPLLLIHGEKDKTTAVRFGRMLYDAANEPKRAHFIAEAGHTDLMHHGFAKAVTDFLDELQAPVDPGNQPALRAFVASPAMLDIT